jgi:hypothetical protein
MESVKTAGNGRPATPRRQPGDAMAQIGTSLQTLASKESIEDLRQRLDLPRRMRTNPYGTLAVALGAGYVLGGGLFSSPTRRLLGVGLKVGLRLGALALLKQQLSLMIGEADQRANRNSTHNQGARS